MIDFHDHVLSAWNGRRTAVLMLDEIADAIFETRREVKIACHKLQRGGVMEMGPDERNGILLIGWRLTRP